MPRFLLVHEGQRIILPEGETLVGRGLSCNVRFNDPAVSRQHLRIVVMDGRAAISNLSSGGATVNGERLEQPRRLFAGDLIRLGYQRVRVELGPDEATEAAPTPVSPPPAGGEERRSTDKLPISDSEIAEEWTRPGEDGWRKRRTSAVFIGDDPVDPEESTPALAPPQARQEPPAPPMTPSRLAEIQIDICPRCHARLAASDDACHACGYSWPPGHPSARTQEVQLATVAARKEPRFAVSVPVIYSSATLTVHAIVRDLSRGGMFIETDVLDPVGTPCEVTALPNGHAALRLTGVVAHVAGDPTLAHLSGLGIQIVGGSPEALRWLERTVARFARAIFDPD
jgi:pSer/pThr/pTyr-binding forkhead associated (FHA) protein